MYIKEAPVDDESTRQDFENAVAKARLIFDHVDVHSKYQCALLYNIKAEEQQEHTLIYTSSNTKKIVTTKINCESAEFIQSGGAHITILDKTRHHIIGEFGLIEHNGHEIIPCIYSDVSAIDDDFFLAKDRHSNGIYDIYDYSGLHWLMVKKGFAARVIPVTVDGEKAVIIDIIAGKKNGKGRDIYVNALYISRNKKLYKAIEVPYGAGVLDIIDNRIQQKNIVDDTIQKVWTIEEIVHQAKEITPYEYLDRADRDKD